jgi:hypothetical protein
VHIIEGYFPCPSILFQDPKNLNKVDLIVRIKSTRVLMCFSSEKSEIIVNKYKKTEENI